jgi:hypothetical protein
MIDGQKPDYWKPVPLDPEIAAKYIKRPEILKVKE